MSLTLTTAQVQEQKLNERLFKLAPTAEQTIISISMACWTLAVIFIVLFLLLRPKVPRVFNLRAKLGLFSLTPEHWFANSFVTNPETAFVNGYGMDASMHILGWNMAFRIFSWLLLISPLPLAINWFGCGSRCPDGMVSNVEGFYFVNSTMENSTMANSTMANSVMENSTITQVFCGPGRDYKGDPVSSFVRLTMTEFQVGNILVVGHIVTLWLITAIVITELRRANKVFTKLRYLWLTRRSSAVQRSLLVMNSTSRSDKEFRETFETMFPGKIVDAQLVKFCSKLAEICDEIQAIEAKIKQEAEINAQKGKTKEDVEIRGEPQGLNKVTSLATKFLKTDLEGRRRELLETKGREQLVIFDLCATETKRVEQLREEEAKQRAAEELEFEAQKNVKQSLSPGTLPVNDPAKLLNPTSLLKGLKGGANFLGAISGIKESNEVFSSAGFVTFTDLRSATIAAQTSYSTCPTEWKITANPDPKEVLWSKMASKKASTNQKRTYVIHVVAAAIFVSWSSLIVIFQGMVDIAVIAIQKWLLGDNYEAILMDTSRVEGWIFGFIDPILKSLVLIIFMAMLPKIFMALSIESGRMVKSIIFLELQSYIVLFKVCFSIYTTSIGGLMQQIFKKIIFPSQVDKIEFDLKSTFGTAVPSVFPIIYTLASNSLADLTSGLLQLDVFKGYAIAHFIFRQPKEFAWDSVQEEEANGSKNKPQAMRFVSLTVLMAMGLIIYQVFPLNACLFFVIFFTGSVCFRYRVLYIDSRLVDSGGLFWTQFELHLVYALLLCIVTGCIAVSSILGEVWVFALILPLPIGCHFFLKHMKALRWQFLSVQQAGLDAVHVEGGDAAWSDFPYVQPQLVMEKTTPSSSVGSFELSEGKMFPYTDRPEAVTIPEAIWTSRKRGKRRGKGGKGKDGKGEDGKGKGGKGENGKGEGLSEGGSASAEWGDSRPGVVRSARERRNAGEVE